MSELRKAAQQALEALEWNYNTDLDNIPACEQWAKMLNETITALKQALAEPEQEPVAELREDMKGGGYVHWLSDQVFAAGTMLYTAPTPQPEQIGNARCPRCWEPITAPTPRKPLSEQELDAMRQADGGALNFVTLRAFRVVARAVERAHGIGEQT